MTPVNSQTSGYQTAVDQELLDPYFQVPTPYSYMQQPHSQPAPFHASHSTVQPSATSGHLLFVPLSPVPYRIPPLYAPAASFTRGPAPVISILGHHSSPHPPSQTQGQTTSTRTSTGYRPSPHQFSSYPAESISHEPETIITHSTSIDAVSTNNSNSDVGHRPNPPAKGNRPGRAGTLKCARCRKQKRGTKVSTTGIVRLI
jgi:hypothetical protein